MKHLVDLARGVRICLLLLLAMLCFVSVSAQKRQENERSTVVPCYPPVQLSTTGSAMQAGDTLWVALSLTDERFLGSSIRIDLVNPYFSVIAARLIRLDKESRRAYFPLADTLAEGLYCLRSYLIWDDFSISYPLFSYIEVNNQANRPQDLRTFRSQHKLWLKRLEKGRVKAFA